MLILLKSSCENNIRNIENKTKKNHRRISIQNSNEFETNLQQMRYRFVTRMRQLRKNSATNWQRYCTIQLIGNGNALLIVQYRY